MVENEHKRSGLGMLAGQFGRTALPGIKSDLKRQPFTGTIEQVKKYRVWLESIK
jgi:hypothetical protein